MSTPVYKCRAKKPNLCKFHGTDAGREAYAVLMEAQTTLDMAAQFGSEGYAMAAENYAKAQLAYDATVEGQADLDLMIAKPKNDFEAMLLEQRKVRALNFISEGEDADLLNDENAVYVKQAREYVKSVKDGTQTLQNFSKNLNTSLYSVSMDAYNYTEEVALYERNFDLMKTAESLENVEKQANIARNAVSLLQNKVEDVLNNAEFCQATISEGENSLVVLGDQVMLNLQKTETRQVRVYVKALNELKTDLAKIDTKFGYRNVPEYVEGLTGRANWNTDKIGVISNQIDAALTKFNQLINL